MKFTIKKSGDSFYAECNLHGHTFIFSDGNLILVKDKPLSNSHCTPYFHGTSKALTYKIRDYFPDVVIEEFKLTFKDIKPGKFLYKSPGNHEVQQWIKLVKPIPHCNAVDINGVWGEFLDGIEVTPS